MLPPSCRPLKPRGEMVMVAGYTDYLSSFIQCIPDEVLFEVLLRLPAQDIYFGARFVCRKWYHTTRSRNFIWKHLERASSGLLCMDDSENFVFVSAREDGGLDTYKLNFNVKITDPDGDREKEKKFSEKYKVTIKIATTSRRVRYPVFSSWNGLMLESDRTLTIYHVTNILTDQAFRLPRCPYEVGYYMWSCIGYDAASMTYKVVVPYSGREQYRCGILTLGVDKSWRIVRTDHLADFVKSSLLSTPFNTEGFVHWSSRRGTILILNLETEIISEISPPLVLKQNSRLCFLPSRRHVSHFVQCGRLVWEVFEMKPEIGEWKRLPNICMEGQNGNIERLVGFNPMQKGVDIVPRGWLKYPEVLALSIAIGSVDYERTFLIFYNLSTCEIGGNTISTKYQRVTPFKNSLELGYSKLGQPALSVLTSLWAMAFSQQRLHVKAEQMGSCRTWRLSSEPGHCKI